ncbi:hypothetical protein FOL47_002594 [Perkinsus chesapeaki]|uniref:Uncharacterized protein n=1 Tax=Perkinsus chesapeaki TaxID=330153 RepID=A0A7J6MCP5_PERCH|nr:hypothetical protein FOL47_002594 [Perkinsus chesapeaki]
MASSVVCPRPPPQHKSYCGVPSTRNMFHECSKTSALGTVTVPVEDLLKRITGSGGYGHQDASTPVPCFGDTLPANGKTVGSCRMSVRARASELVKIVYDASDGAYYLQLDVEVDMPTAPLSEEILAHVKPTSSSPTRDNFDEVPISQIRELGHSGTAVWQSYKGWNRWHKTKHRAVYFIRPRTATLDLPKDIMNLGGVAPALNANAPEFTPCSSAVTHGPPSDGEGGTRKGSEDCLDRGSALLLPSEVAALLGDNCLHEEVFGSDVPTEQHRSHEFPDYHDDWRNAHVPASRDPWLSLSMGEFRCRLTSTGESSTASSSLVGGGGEAPNNESPSRATEMW